MNLRSEVFVNAPARAAWAVLGERFADIGEWAVPITAWSLEGTQGRGAVRTCHAARFGPVPAGTITERLLDFDPHAMSFAYEAIGGMPGSIADAVNHWSVHPLDGQRCLARTHATLTVRGPAAMLAFILKRKLQTDGARVLDELRHWVEHGRPHPRKVRAIEHRNIVRVP